jgi:acyl carrier protein
MEQFEIGIAELLEVDSVSETDILHDFEDWDSLTSLSIIAFIDENYSVAISANDLTEAKTIGGLKKMIASKTLKG